MLEYLASLLNDHSGDTANDDDSRVFYLRLANHPGWIDGISQGRQQKISLQWDSLWRSDYSRRLGHGGQRTGGILRAHCAIPDAGHCVYHSLHQNQSLYASRPYVDAEPADDYRALPDEVIMTK